VGRQGLRIEQVRLTHPDALRLVADVQAEYAVLYGSPDETPLDPTMFDPPTGRFFVGYDADAGRPVATGAWRDRPDVHDLGLERAAEIKRMYVAPAARGRGLSRIVLAHLEETARAAGHDGLVLETGTRQPAAVALYTACGYVPVVGYGHYKDAPESVYLGKRLD
jgi:GNAT superfamily N-acetyltransferase